MTRKHMGLATALLIACAAVAATAFAFALHNASAVTTSAPTATQFATILETTVNAYAEAHGDSTLLVGPDCVSPSAGLYMCSYAAKRGNVSQCHIMQGKWVPGGSYVVTKAGRVGQCSTLRAALASLG